jgi:hypothetical protein
LLREIGITVVGHRMAILKAIQSRFAAPNSTTANAPSGSPVLTAHADKSVPSADTSAPSTTTPVATKPDMASGSSSFFDKRP